MHESHEKPAHNLSSRFFSHAKGPKNLGPLNAANGRAKGIGTCGDSLQIYLRVENATIRDIGHVPKGCVYTVASGSALTELARGKSLDDVLKITPEDVATELGGLPEDHMHCAVLAVNTLGEAIEDYYQRVWGMSRP